MALVSWQSIVAGQYTVLQGYRAQGYRAQFGIFEKIESRAIGPTYKISKILFFSIEKNKLFDFLF